MEPILGPRRRCLRAEFRLKFSNSYGSFIDEDEEEVSAEIGAVAPLSDTLRMSGGSGMTPSSRDRISVDLRGLRAALLAQARARGVTPSDLVRGVLAEALDDVDSGQRARFSDASISTEGARALITSSHRRASTCHHIGCQSGGARDWRLRRRLGGRRASSVRRRQPHRPHGGPHRVQRRNIDPQPKHPPPDLAAATGRISRGLGVPAHARYVGR